MRVYKFLNAKWGLKALEDRRLKIARISDLNDPFELLGINLSNRELRKAFVEMKYALAKNRGLLCFSKRWRNPLLWGHYSDGHRGLCLGFDVPDELLMGVNYTRKRTASEKLFSNDQSVKEREMKRLLSTKFSHWRYENEVRCFVSLEDKDPHNGHYFLNSRTRCKSSRFLLVPKRAFPAAMLKRLSGTKMLKSSGSRRERLSGHSALCGTRSNLCGSSSSLPVWRR